MNKLIARIVIDLDDVGSAISAGSGSEPDQVEAHLLAFSTRVAVASAFSVEELVALDQAMDPFDDI